MRSLSSANRRRFLQSTALGAGLVAAPFVLRAQGSGIKIGVLHPVSGALSYSGQQGRIGAQLAIEEINAAGGIKSMGGSKIEAVLGDAQSTPDGGNAEVEKMNSARRSMPHVWNGCSASPASSSSISPASLPTAAWRLPCAMPMCASSSALWSRTAARRSRRMSIAPRSKACGRWRKSRPWPTS